MNFESAIQTAARLNVSVRAVQKWAKEGKLPGAKKNGREWLIPEGIVPGIGNEQKIEKIKNIPELVLGKNFPIGECLHFIEQISNVDQRNIALCEYNYFCGNVEESSRIAEVYLNSKEPILRYVAAIFCSLANISREHYHMARYALDILQENIYNEIDKSATNQMKALGMFAATTSAVLLHLPIAKIPPMEEYLRYLPKGMKLFACYLLARKAYMENDYSRAIGISTTALQITEEVYPIPRIYLHVITAVCKANLMEMEKAEYHVKKAWSLAKEDGFYEVFGEHYMLLHGLIEKVFKKQYPEDFEKIMEIAKQFGPGWVKLHNESANKTVADNLTMLEFTIAMLFNRNWRIKEIAHHLEISERMVKNHLSIIYEKLGIASRKELHQYMIQ